METGHRGDEAKPQAIAARRPALLQADKAVQQMPIAAQARRLAALDT